METKEKLAVFEKLARALDSERIRWAVGGSLMLYLRGIVETFHDLDIMIAPEDVEKTKRLLSGCAKAKETLPNEKYQSGTFLQYEMEGVDLDCIADFTIVAEGKMHVFPLRTEEIERIVVKDDFSAPVQSVETWRKCYMLMERADKTIKIDEWMKRTKFE